MIWDTSIWRLACSNRSKIPSAQKCYLCLRYVVSPMSHGRTLHSHEVTDGIEPATTQLSYINGFSLKTLHTCLTRIPKRCELLVERFNRILVRRVYYVI